MNRKNKLTGFAMALAGTSLLATSSYTAPGPAAVGPGWVEIPPRVDGMCPAPVSICAAKFVDPQPQGETHPTSGRALYGILFQQIQHDLSWLECGPFPESFNGTTTFYEAFILEGPAGAASAESAKDSFTTFGLPDEAIDTTFGNSIYLRITPGNARAVIAEYLALQNKPGPDGENFVRDSSGNEVTVPAPQGGLIKFTTGGIPNDVNPPPSWPNFVGVAPPVSGFRFQTQFSICCPDGVASHLCYLN